MGNSHNTKKNKKKKSIKPKQEIPTSLEEIVKVDLESKIPNNTVKRKKSKRVSIFSFVKKREVDINDVYTFIGGLVGNKLKRMKKARHNETGIVRGVKIINKKGISSELKKAILREIFVLKNLDHPNIIRIYEFFESKTNIYVVQQLIENAELLTVLTTHYEYITEQQIAEIMKQILSAITFLHTNKIVHSSLQADKIMYIDGRIKIVDFSTAVPAEDLINELDKSGNTFYIAPEVLQGSYNYKVDVYSAGIILYMLLTGKKPFTGGKDLIKSRIEKSQFEVPINQITKISDEAKDVLLQMLKLNPEERPSAMEILKHDFFKEDKINQKHKTKLEFVVENLKQLQFNNKLHDAIFTFIIREMSLDREEKELTETFQQMDKNNDGMISFQELNEYFQKMNLEYDREEVLEIFKMMDSDGNGHITYSEFINASVRKDLAITEKNVMKIFRVFDQKGDGKIDLERFKDFLNATETFEEEEFIQLFKDMDLNGDGYIDFQEFKIALNSLKKKKNIKVKTK